jgi:dTDP-4-amino-4,6-dideoxygalactose transaminase
MGQNDTKRNKRMSIPFNKPFISGKEKEYIASVIDSGMLNGEGPFTRFCCEWMERSYGFQKVMLTTSATIALEMAALLIDIRPGDEVIVPSYTFASTANAFALRGAEIVCADSLPGNPNIDPVSIEALITARTKAIVVVHYAGVACDMAAIRMIADRHKLFLIEDASQAVHAYHDDKPLGSFGHLSAFSFHSTKNLTSGEGGMLIMNEGTLSQRAEVIAEKGTNRAAFLRGETPAYSWTGLGSSCMPSEVTAAFLAAQLERTEEVHHKRLALWNGYYSMLHPFAGASFTLPEVPAYARHNAHTFYLVCSSREERDSLIASLREKGVQAAFHYQALHSSPFYKQCYRASELPNATRYSEQLVRLPLYFDLSPSDVQQVSEAVLKFYIK